MKIIHYAILVGGVISMLVVIAHTQFYRIFSWKEHFKVLSLRDRKILYTIHFFLILLFLIFPFLSFFYTDVLVSGTGLAAVITSFYSLFWFCRGIWQILYLNPSQFADKNNMNIYGHYIIILGSFILTSLYLLPILYRWII